MAGQHRAAGAPSPGRPHRVSAVLGIALLGLASLLIALPASAQETGQVRLGHLSPSTPAVDVYLTAPGAEPSRTPAVAAAGYGAVTGYQQLAAGRWTVQMRPAGASPDIAAPLSAALDVTPGSAQSLLFFDTGEGGQVQGQLVTDDLTPAAAGSGRLRVIQGASGEVEMQAAGGPRLATGLGYGSITDYATVDARRWDVAIASGDESLQAALDVAPGSVSTVLLTRDAAGALVATPSVDVLGTAAAAPSTSLSAAPSGGPVAAPGEETPPATSGTGTPETVEPAPALPSGGVPAGGGFTAGGPDPAPVLVGLAGALLLVFGMSGRPVARARHR